MGQAEVKVSLLTDEIILFLRPKYFIRKPLELINNFRKMEKSILSFMFIMNTLKTELGI